MARLRGIDLELPLILHVSKIIAREKHFGDDDRMDTQGAQHAINADRCQRIRVFAIQDPEDVRGSLEYANDWWNSPEKSRAPVDMWPIKSLMEMVTLHRQYFNLPMPDLVLCFMTLIHCRSSRGRSPGCF